MLAAAVTATGAHGTDDGFPVPGQFTWPSVVSYRGTNSGARTGGASDPRRRGGSPDPGRPATGPRLAKVQAEVLNNSKRSHCDNSELTFAVRPTALPAGRWAELAPRPRGRS